MFNQKLSDCICLIFLKIIRILTKIFKEAILLSVQSCTVTLYFIKVYRLCLYRYLIFVKGIQTMLRFF